LNKPLRLKLVTLGLVALALWLGSTLVEHWRLRPTGRPALYQEIAQWLHEHTLPGETVAAQQADMLRHFSDRPTLALPAAAQAPDLLVALDRARPDYCVAPNSLAWHGVRAHPWFQERYRPVHQLASPYDSITPLTVFRYTPSPFDSGEITSKTLGFITDNQEWIELAAYRLDTQRLTPDEPLHLTLHWRARTAMHTHLLPVVRLVDPLNGRVWVQAKKNAPGGLATNSWNADTAVTDRYTLSTPGDLPPGDYVLDVALYPQGQGKPLPAGERGEPLRRAPLMLTRLYRPPEVSTALPTPDHSLSLTFGDVIELAGYDAPERVAPGETWRVALYWHARQAVLLNYKVFVHLLTIDGQAVSQDDGLPVHWTYLTTQWQPGEYIRDEHVLELEPDVPRGDYTLSVGLYDADTGERPLVRDANGHEIIERRVVLAQIQVR